MDSTDRSRPSSPEQLQQPKPEGMTVTEAQDLLRLMAQGMDADEDAKVERELSRAVPPTSGNATRSLARWRTSTATTGRCGGVC